MTHQTSNRPCVLIVDDTKVMRTLLGTVVESMGLDCVAVGSAEEAIERLETTVFAALVTDKNLPGMNGLEVARVARLLQPRLPMLLITGHSTEESAREAASLGVQDYLTKPFDMDAFQRRLDDLLCTPVGGPESLEQPAAEADERSSTRPPPPFRPPPDSVPPRASVSPERATEPLPGDCTSLNVLVVEPDFERCARLKEILSAIGCRVEALVLPQQAESYVRSYGFDVLLASPEVLRSKRHWFDLAPRRPLGSIALMPGTGIDKVIEGIQVGARGILAPPYEIGTVVPEFQHIISRLQEEQSG